MKIMKTNKDTQMKIHTKPITILPEDLVDIKTPLIAMAKISKEDHMSSAVMKEVCADMHLTYLQKAASTKGHAIDDRYTRLFVSLDNKMDQVIAFMVDKRVDLSKDRFKFIGIDSSIMMYGPGGYHNVLYK